MFSMEKVDIERIASSYKGNKLMQVLFRIWFVYIMRCLQVKYLQLLCMRIQE